MSAGLTPLALGLAVALSAATARADVGDFMAEAAIRLAADALAALGSNVIGGLVEPSKAPRDPLPELADWNDPATNSTSRMRRGCGVLVETTLTGNTDRNFLNLVVLNETQRSLRVVPAYVRFGDGTVRWFSHGRLQLSSKARAAVSVAFPSKSDFAGQRSFDVVLAVASCWLPLRYERLPNLPQDPSSYREYSEVEFWAGGGFRFDATGGPRTFGRSDGVAIEIGTARYFSPHHGFSFELLSDTDGSSAPAFQVQGLGLAMGYVARLYPLSWLSLTFGPSIGFVSYGFSDDVQDDQTWVLALQNRLRLQARLFRDRDMGTVSLAPSLVYQLIADGELAGVGLRGSTAAAMLSLGVGL